MLLPQSKCKGDHILKKIIRILFNTKYEVERERDRDQVEDSHCHGFSSILLVFLQPGFLGGEGLQVVLYTVQVLSIHRVVTDALPITWGDMCTSSCFLSSQFAMVGIFVQMH